jgi:Domain of Unknown Function (DUF928)
MINRLAIRSIFLFGLLLIPVSAIADDPDQAPSSGRSAGGRGCGTTMPSTKSNVPNLILLAPQERTKQTVSTRPMFAWFVRDAEPVAMEFRLYAQTENNRYQLIKEEQFQSSPGIMVMTLNQTVPELAIGKYRWQVVLVCDRDRPSSNLFATSEIEVVPVPVDLKTRLGQTNDRMSQALLYAQANLWYDALGTAINSSNHNSALKDSRLALLDKLTLDSTERQLLQNSAIHSVQREEFIR